MPKLVYEDGREQEVTILNQGYSPNTGKTINVSVKLDAAETLRDDLVYVMRERQRGNLLPFEIVQGMLLHIGSSGFYDDLIEALKHVRDYTAFNQQENENLPSVTANKLLEKWGFVSNA